MLSEEVRALYQRQLDDATRRYTTLSAELDAALGSASVEDYSFQDAEGQQRVKRRDVGKIYDLLERLEKRMKWLSDKLGGRGLSIIVLRRRP